jgi:hypothetical protein
MKARAKRIAVKLFDMMNSSNPRLKIKAKRKMDKINKDADKGKLMAKAIIQYMGALAKEEKGDRVMEGCR